MRKVHAARGGIDRDVVEVLASGPLRRAEAVFLEQVITGRGRHHQRGSTQHNHQHATCDAPDTIRLHTNPPFCA